VAALLGSAMQNQLNIHFEKNNPVNVPFFMVFLGCCYGYMSMFIF
jgi:hypothetical protein